MNRDGQSGFDADGAFARLLAPRTAPGAGVDARSLARLWGCPTRDISALEKNGVAVSIEPGRYDVSISTRNYVRSLRARAGGHASSDAGVSAGLRYKQAQTALLDLKFKRKAGLLVAVDDTRALWAQILRQIRQSILALPGQITFEIPNLTRRDRRNIERVVHEALTEVANGKMSSEEAEKEMQ